MKIHELKVSSTTDRKRVGRGIGSGYGKTAGRGTKGQNSRTGGGVRPGFEGGQNPLAKRLPKKRGFAAVNPTIYQVVNLSGLARLGGASVVDASVLKGAGLISSAMRPVKLLANGEVTSKLILKVNAASASAKAAVEKAGGTVEIVPMPRVASKKPTRVKTEERVEA